MSPKPTMKNILYNKSMSINIKTLFGALNFLDHVLSPMLYMVSVTLGNTVFSRLHMLMKVSYNSLMSIDFDLICDMRRSSMGIKGLDLIFQE